MSHHRFARGGLLSGAGAALALFLAGFLAPVQAAFVTSDNTVPAINGVYARYWTSLETQVLARANAVAVDADGNVYTAGYRDSGTGTDFLTAKHDSAGNLIWERTYNGGGYDEALALALDGAGNVYVTGRSHNGTDYDYVTVAYSGLDGTDLWSGPAVYDSKAALGLTAGDDEPVAIVVGATDKIYVTGRSYNGVDYDYATIRYTSSGNEVWVERYDGKADLDAQVIEDEPVGLGLDAGGDVYVAGDSRVTVCDAGQGCTVGFVEDFVVFRLSAVNGNPVWKTRYDSGGSDDAAAMAVDGAGNVYLAGTRNQGGRDLIAAKFDSSGNPAWSGAAVYDSGNAADMAVGVDVDAAGNVYVAGKIGSVLDRDYATVKYDAGGTQQWVAVYDSGGNDEPSAIAVDPAGNAYVTGATGTAGSGRDIVTVRFDAATGAQTDVLIQDQGGDETPGGLALGTDNEGLATVHIAMGSDRTVPQQGDYTIVKYGVARPELVPTQLGAPVEAKVGGVMTLTNEVANLFDSRAGILATAVPVEIGFYLVPPGIALDDVGNFIPLATRCVNGDCAAGALAPGASDRQDTTVSVPDGLADGDYTPVVIVDPAGRVPERDETNNQLAGAVIRLKNVPDLVPDSIAVSGATSSFPAAATMSVDFSISNLRATPSGSFDVAFFLSADTQAGNADDVALSGTATVGGVAGNGTTGTLSASVTIPNTTPPGTYYLGVVADSANQIDELDETNNTLLGIGQLTVEPIVDLTVADVSPGVLGATVGDSIPVDVTVQASTTGDAGPFYVAVYLSTDPVLDASDLALAPEYQVAAGLAAGTSVTVTPTVTIPTSVTQGVYYLIAVADARAEVPENNETNNDRSSAGTISVGADPAVDSTAKPDLVVTDVTAPLSAARGDTFTVSTTVENVLAKDAAGPFRVGVYLSSDPVISTSDMLIGSQTLSGLAGNTATQPPLAIDVTIPIDLFDTFKYRKSLTVAAAGVSGTGDLSDFPVLVHLTDPDLRSTANGGRVENANGYDIVFYTADGATRLPHDLAKYDPVTGEMVAWVRVPLLSGSADTTFYVYYGNVSITTPQSDSRAVWGNGYKGVWYLDGTGAALSAAEKSGSNDDAVLLPQWSKHNNGNSVLALGPSGAFDDFYVNMPSVIKDGNVYKMWYSGYDGSHWRIGYATSPDGISWTRENGGNPVLDLGPAGAHDSYGVFRPTVIKDGGIYKMWYTAHNGTTLTIGYATSVDGVTWVKSSSNPVLGRGAAGKFDSANVANAAVVIENGVYKMWYSGYDGTNNRIGYATSPDGISWTRENGGNPVLDIGPAGSYDDFGVFAPAVVPVGGTYRMWYSAAQKGGTIKVAYATSQDGITWVKFADNPVLQDSILSRYMPSVVREASDYKMWFGTIGGSNQWIGHALVATSRWGNGRVDNAALFDGVTQRVSLGKGAALQLTGPLSICAWVDPDTDNTDREIVRKGNDYYLRLQSDNRVAFALRNAANDGWKTAVSAAQVLSGDGWTHVCGTFDGSIMQVYVNGQRSGAGVPKSDGVYTSGALYSAFLGASDIGGVVSNAFSGAIDEVRISSVARPADWVATQYNNQNAPGTFLTPGLEEPSGITFTYYLGAIVDDLAGVDEVDENNNAQVHTNAAGDTEGTAVGILVSGAPASGGGGGALGWAELLFALTAAGLGAVRRSGAGRYH